VSSLVTPRVRFLHVPKTGGTWVEGALRAAGVPTQPLARPDDGIVAAHATLRVTSDYAERFTLAFVRHPLDWWRSFWGYRMRTGWVEDHEIDSRARSDDFNEFAELVTHRLPGHLTARFERYIGPPDRPISYIGRFEALVDDLVQALALAGEQFDEAALRAHQATNRNDYERYPAEYVPDVAARLAAAEHALLERFYPGEPAPGWVAFNEARASARASVKRTC
jgi:hypothetical protein